MLSTNVKAQSADSVWSLQRCIDYALGQNIDIRKSILLNHSDQVNLRQAKADRFPSLSASVNQNFSWNRSLSSDLKYGSYSGASGSNYGFNSSVQLYGGFKNWYNIRQSELSYEAGQNDVEAIKESVSLSVLDAYLQILYANEQVNNSEKQIEATTDQLRLADERYKLGAIARSDYLQVKSELSSEKLTLANAQSLLTINKVTLMQLMELPVTPSFDIEYPELSDITLLMTVPSVDSVYQQALTIRPEIKSAELNRQAADLGVNIAKSGYQPELSLNGSLSTDYTSASPLTYDYQVRNKISPFVGLSLSIPLYANRQIRSGVELAEINSRTALLNETDAKNQLRKEIEQASTDILTAQKRYEASLEQYNSSEEAYNVAVQKYDQGLISSVDFLVQKTSYISAESELLQSKYNLVFSYKILDFYMGHPLTLNNVY